MPKILDPSQALNVAEVILDAQDETGFPNEEFIPGLIQAIIQLASRYPDGDQILDEAANFLADGGV